MIQSLHYFPCVNGIVDLLNQSVLTFDGDFPFKRSSFRNRTIIAGATGPITLSIPVVGGRNVKMLYKEVEIDYNNNWQRDHFRTLCTAYGNSPFFQFYRDEIEMIYNANPKYLFEWNMHCLRWIMKKMKFSVQINESQQLPQSNETVYLINENTPQNYMRVVAEPLIQYTQVFQDKTGFLPNLSILDLLFNAGPGAHKILLNAFSKLHPKSTV